jgi:DNA primase
MPHSRQKEDVMMTEWVDFKKLKEAVNMQMVLDRYGIKGLRRSGDELRGVCPIHKGSDRSKNFTVNVRRNAFKCFSRDCGASGNVLDLVAAIERCSVREAALKLKEWFKVGESESESRKQNDENWSTKIRRGIYRDKDDALYELVAVAASAENSEPVVVYRELFGNYCYWVTPMQAFWAAKGSEQARFSLVKGL